MKAVLEKTLEDVKRDEEQERDSYTLMRLSQRRQVVEQKLTGVRQQLAESSKVLTSSGWDASLLYVFAQSLFFHAIFQTLVQLGWKMWHINVPPWVLETHLFGVKSSKVTSLLTFFLSYLLPYIPVVPE